MNEYSQRHFMKAADTMMRGQAGQTVTFDWLASHTGLYDDARQEYGAGTATRTTMQNVACMVYRITGNDITYGDWGSAQVGDLVIGFDRDLDLDTYEDLKIIWNQQEYKLEPKSNVPMDSMAGVIG
ncbi:MAG: hypothetical protein ACXABY_30385, partial [Candidatus Thorarchaeota archaeon]